MKRRLVKNVIANVGRGGTAAIVALILPPILIRHMEPAAYAVWVLILQVASYMGFLDFGLQTAVGRYIAFAEQRKDPDARDSMFSTALAGLSLASVIGIVVLLLIALMAARIFPNIPSSLLPSMRAAILIVGVSTAIGLPASAPNGVFVGLQQYEVPAVTLASGRVLTAIALIFAALSGSSLVAMACMVAGVNMMVYVSQFALLSRMAPQVRLRTDLITKGSAKELAGYCLSLTIWSLSTLLVTGFDLILVGRFQFGAVAVYSASAVLITFLGGLQTSVFNVMMPHSAALHADGDANALGSLLLRSTKLGTSFLLLTGLPLVVFASIIIRVWLGPAYMSQGTTILIVLVLGNMIRLLGVPYSSILVGTGQQRLIIIGPLLEGISNLGASIFLGLRFGALGVAWGTFIGSAVGLAAILFYSLPKTRRWIALSPTRLMVQVILTLACGIPVILALLYTRYLSSYSLLFRSLGLCVTMMLCLGFVSRETVFRKGQ